MAGKKGTPELSICIPTFNRAACLDRLLSCLAHELEGLEGRAEICVSDNCSSDSTQKVVAKWRKLLPLSANRNSQNMGFDINLVRSLQLARGKYVWCMGDDDTVCEGAMQRVLEDIKLAKAAGIGAIYLNAQNKGKPILGFGFAAFRAFSNSDPARPQVNVSFMGSVCLKRSTALEVISKNTTVSGKRLLKKKGGKGLLEAFAHSYLFLETASQCGKFGVEPSPCVRIVADGGSISYGQKFCGDMLLMAYSLEIRKGYGWFRDWSRNYGMKAHLVRLALCCLRPGLEEAHLAAMKGYVMLLGLSGAKRQIAAVRALEAARKFPPTRTAIALSFLAARALLGIGVNDKEEGPRMAEKLKLSIARLEAAMQPEPTAQ